MSRNRIIPFGYCMKNGEITTEPKEVYAVAMIFSEYLNGSSLLQIAKMMESEKIRYSEDSNYWNKNMVKRILENKKYMGENNFPAIIDRDIFQSANAKKQVKSNAMKHISEELQTIRGLLFCGECGCRLYRSVNSTGSEYWNCKNPCCEKIGYRLTDNMLIGSAIAVLNTAMANPDLLDSNEEISAYIPDMEVTRQQNEINRITDNPDVDFDKAKEEIFRLAELKYNCCTYSEKPQKTAQLKAFLADCEQQNTLNIGLLKFCISRILVGRFYTVEFEFINGVTIKNITERTDKNDHSGKCNDNSGESADCGKSQ